MANEPLPSIPKDLLKLSETSKVFDVSIRVGEKPNTKTFAAHFSILTTRSQYFAAALSGDWAKKENGIVEFTKPNIAPQVFEIILRHIYNEEISLEKYEFPALLEILVAVDEILLEELTERIETYLITNHAESLNQKFALVHRTAFKYESCKKLRKFCTDLTSTNPKVVFYSEDFTSLDEDLLISLLQRDYLSMNEIDIWNKVVEWGIAQISPLPADLRDWSAEDFGSLARVLDGMLPLIRFYHISSSDFYRKVKPYAKIIPRTLYKDLLHHQNYSVSKFFSIAGFYMKDGVKRHTAYSEVSDGFIAAIRAKSQRFECPSVLILPSQLHKLIEWIRQDPSNKSRYGIKLLCRGSRDGFTVEDFHRKCDHKGATIIVIKVKETGQIIGGYNPLSWNQNGVWESGVNSFIFSFGTKPQPEQKLSRYIAGFGIVSSPLVGPIFGFAWDLYIAGPDFTTAYSSCRGSRSYEHRIMKGAHNDKVYFRIEEYEVIRVILQK